MLKPIITLTLLGTIILFFPTSLGAADNIYRDPAVPSAIQNNSVSVSHKIDPALLRALQQGGDAHALVVLSEQADLSGADALDTKQAKGAFVYNALREVADRTQARLRADLDRRGVSFRAFYIANAIAVPQLDLATANAMARESSVGRIVPDPEIRFSEPAISIPQVESSGTVSWGIKKIGADKLWKTKIRGNGIVVANADTGVQWNHPALIGKYRGYDGKTGTADHSYNWWDAIHGSITGGTNPCGYDSPAPCDDMGHGTHTMGTMVGRGGDNRIGVAPKAKWIACRNMAKGVGRPTTYMECFEFFLAPWDANGKNPDPARAPDVVNNSWGCPIGAPPTGEDCAPDTLKQATNALRQAGIFIAMSAGNSGAKCNTVTDPSGIYNAAITIGATDKTDALESFSSRGPVTTDNSQRRKPDLVAPGVSIRSSIPGNGYGLSSGTSMAAPHVAGSVALLWQAFPNLRGKVAQTENALFGSAKRNVTIKGNPNQVCGGTTRTHIPNNLFGYGRLNIKRAVERLR